MQRKTKSSLDYLSVKNLKPADGKEQTVYTDFISTSRAAPPGPGSQELDFRLFGTGP
jgi:hypothetical protein